MSTPVKGLFLLLALPALAQDPAADPTLLGAGARSRPAYDGSASQYLEAVPVLRYWTALGFARSTRGPLEGGFHVQVLPGLDAGVQLAYEQGRAARESARPEGAWARRVPAPKADRWQPGSTTGDEMSERILQFARYEA